MVHLWRPLHSRNLVSLLMVAGMAMVFAEEVLDDVLAVVFGFEETQLGWLFAAIYLLAALASKWGTGLVHGKPMKWVVVVLFAFSALSLMVSPWLGLIAGGATVMLRYATRAVLANLESDIINREAVSGNRATRLSAFAMIKGLPYLFLAFWIGGWRDRIGARSVALGTGLLLAAILLVFAGPLLRGKKHMW